MSSNVPGKPGAVSDDNPVVKDQPNLYQFSGDSSKDVPSDRPSSLDYYRFSGDGRDKSPQPRPDSVAPTTSDSPADVARAALESPTATAQDKLKAVEKLLSTGVDKLEVTDRDGTKRQLRLELDMSVGKPLVHVFTNEGGKERVLLRAVSNGDGTYKNQRGKNGEVGFYGDWWSKNMSDKSNFVESKQPIARGDQFKPEMRADGLYMPRRIEQYQPNQRTQPVVWDRFQPNNRLSDGILPIPNITDMTNGNTDQVALNQAFDAAKNGLVNGRRPVYFRAGMTIDADGSPRARQIDPTGQTQTSLRYPDGRSVNAETVPYFVLPGGKYKELGIKLGDIAAVRYNGKVAFAVFADVGPRHKLGEGSIALAQELGIPASPRTGGVRSGVEYMVFPGSGDRTPGDPRRNFYAGAQMLRAAQGDNRRYV
jgi:hypothetical protein